MGAIKNLSKISHLQNDLNINKNVIVSITDLRGRLIYANENYCRIIGYNQHEIIGEAHKILECPRHKEPKYRELWKTIKKGKVWKGVLKNRTHDGKVTWLEATISPILNKRGNINKYMGIYNEISKNYNREMDEIESDLKCHTIFKLMNVSIMMVVESRGFITEWNKGAEKAFGYLDKEILGKNITQLIAPADRDKSLCELKKVANNLSSSCLNETIEMMGVKKNGDQFPLEITLNKWEIGNRTYYSAIMMDITKRKALEKKLRKKSRDLEVFLYRSAHELMAPISTSEGIVDLMKYEKVNDSIIELTSLLDTTLEMGKTVVEKMANSSITMETSKGPEMINFRKIIDSVIHYLSKQYELDGIKFKVKILAHSGFYSYKNLLKLLFKNLIENAIKFKNPEQEDFESIISIEIDSVGRDIQIKVSDNGAGIPMENIDKIFELFYSENLYQVNGNVNGNGLGLYIVNNIVDELNGNIYVESEFKNGTCFTIFLSDARI